MKDVGLSNIAVQKEKVIKVPDSILLNYLNPAELKKFRESGTGIFSITVYAEKFRNSFVFLSHDFLIFKSAHSHISSFAH